MGGGVCYSCGKPEHIAKDCPHAKGQDSKSDKGDKKAGETKTKARVFAMTEEDAKTTEDLQVRSQSILFLLMCFLIVVRHIPQCDDDSLGHLKTQVVREPYKVFTPRNKILVSDLLQLHCPVEIDGRNMLANLIQLKMNDFDVILGMDWLAKNYAKVDCYNKNNKIEFALSQVIGEFEFQRSIGKPPKRRIPVISAIKAWKSLRKGNEGYLACVVENKKDELRIEDIPVVKQFPDVFPKDLPGLLEE